MTSEDITVDLRLNVNADSKCKAFADVTIALGSDGVIKISGYSVIQKDGRGPWVAPPARKGTSTFFPVLHLMGRIDSLVSEVVLSAYRKAAESGKAADPSEKRSL